MTTLPAPTRTALIAWRGHRIKLESSQPSGSVKYRLVHAKLMAALERDELSREPCLVEVTSGSTGSALALLGAQLGLPVELHVFDSLPPAEARALEGQGARLVRHSPTRRFSEILDEVEGKVKAGTHWWLRQYERASNLEAYEDFAAELIEQLEGFRPRHFVAGVGTGGVLQGLGSRLRQVWPDLEIVAVEPLGAAGIPGLRNTANMHLGAQDPYDRDFPDATYRLECPEGPVSVEGQGLGLSATACLQAVSELGLTQAIVVAAD